MKIIYETKNFNVFVPDVPHISREEGGHLCISSKRDNCLSRLDLSIDEAIEFIRLSMLVGDAMTIGMKNGGVDVIMINYQENGNWAYLRNEKPFFIFIYMEEP
ncbi:MAG: hypothetical protein IJ093_03555 [Bacilli bacterium]|nr:hypothetical protein [Bacilli bacterium]